MQTTIVSYNIQHFVLLPPHIITDMVCQYHWLATEDVCGVELSIQPLGNNSTLSPLSHITQQHGHISGDFLLSFCAADVYRGSVYDIKWTD